MGKKLNNYVRFPLILGVTCLLCGGALAGVNFITSPIIKENNDKKANQSLDDIIGKGNYTKAETVAADIDSPNILSVKKVTLNSGEEVYYYQLESTKGYSGTVTFAIVYSANGIMGYKFISATEDSLGVGIAKQESKWNESLASYDASKGNFVYTGGSAKATVPAIKAAVDIAYADYMAKQGIVIDTSLIKFSGGLSNTTASYKFYTLTATNSTSGYGSLKLVIRIDVKKNVVKAVKVLDYAGATDEFGKDLLTKGNGGQLNESAQNFYNTYIKVPSSGLPFDLFVGDNAADVQDDSLNGNNAIFNTGASFTARSYYALIQKAIIMYQTGDEGSFTDVKAQGKLISTVDSRKTYSVLTTNDNSGYGSLVADVTVDSEAKKVMSVKVTNYVNATYTYGYALVNGKLTNIITNDTFIESYVKIPEEGLDYSVFDALDPNAPKDDSAFKTGATYTAKAYFMAVKQAIDMDRKGETGSDFEVPANSYAINIESLGNGKYHAVVKNSLDTANFSIVDATIELDVASRKVKSITFDLSKIGTDLSTGQYGQYWFTDNGNNIYEKYVKVPEGGFDFDLFLSYDPQKVADANSDVANDANTTGATYSVNNYFTMVCAVINYALGGK